MKKQSIWNTQVSQTSLIKGAYASVQACGVALCAGSLLLAGCGGGGGSGDSDKSSLQLFQVDIANVSTSTTFVSGNTSVPVIFSPAILAVHAAAAPFYTIGQPARANGVESFAEDADPSDLIETLQSQDGISLIALAQTPIGTESSGLLNPGSTYRAVVRAAPGDRLSLALAFVQGNDILAGTGDQGIPLFDAGDAPISADVTGNIALIDVGTEVNEKPGFGANQPPQQPMPNTGAAESAPVGPVADGFAYPAVPAMLRVTITPQ